jgi:hypothetical protein
MTNTDSYDEWERSIVLELRREHEYVCHFHKVRLRPVTILLFDSESRWGQFNELTRTISISIRLVLEHPWHQVVGIFRHEMAHQLVAENRTGAAGHPHDEHFHDACRRLGVPDHFARAGVDLKQIELDWRSEKRDEATERILEKVRKLLALASSSNEHEALLAMERVRELYAKYNLENAQSESMFFHVIICDGKKRMESWQQKAMSILMEHFFVKVITFRQFDPPSSERHFAIELIGTRENVWMAEYVYYFLQNHSQMLVQNMIETYGKDFGRIERSSYRLGILNGFDEKLRRAERVDEPNHSPHQRPGLTLIGQALAKFKRNPKLENYLGQIYPRLSSRRRSSHIVDDTAFAAGRQAGRSITLNKPLTQQSGNQGKLLGGR